MSIAEAEATYHALAKAYAGLGYELVALPLAPVSERVGFVQARITQVPNDGLATGSKTAIK